MIAMDVVIVEDEKGPAEHLTAILKSCDELISIRAVLGSIEESVQWFKSNPHPDIGFFDIQLDDGLSFDIFEKAEISFPVIFTTAYSQYALNAFRVNSVDYLLKPIKRTEIYSALLKFQNRSIKQSIDYKALAKEIVNLRAAESFTLLINHKDKLLPVPAADFSYFFIQHGLLHGACGARVMILTGMTMDELHERLDMRRFFRVSRQYIVNRTAIADIETHFQSKLALRLNPIAHEAIMVSKARVSAFKNWLSTGVQ